MALFRACCPGPSATYLARTDSHGNDANAFVTNPWSVNVGVFGPNKSGKNTFLKQILYSSGNMTPRLVNALVFHARKHWVNEVVRRLKDLEKSKLKKFQKEVKQMSELSRRLESVKTEPYDKATKMITNYNSSLFRLLDGIWKYIFKREDEYLQCRSAFSLDPRVPSIDLTHHFRHTIHPTNFSPAKYKTEQFKYKFFHSYYKSLDEEMEVEDIGRELDMIILLLNAADVVEPGKFEDAVRTHKWIIDIALNEYGPLTMIVLTHIDVLDEHCNENGLSISKELDKCTDFLAETFAEINSHVPKTPHIEAMDLTKGKFFYRILKTVNSAMVEEVDGMPLKQYKEQRKRNFLKSVYSIGGRRGSQAAPQDVNTLVRASFENGGLSARVQNLLFEEMSK